jgi:hypothetical protein
MSAITVSFGVYKILLNFTIRANASVLQDLKWNREARRKAILSKYGI